MRSRWWWWCGGLRVHAWLSPWIITSRCGIRIMPDCLLLSGCLFLFLDMLQDLRLGFHRPQMIPTFLLLDLSWSNPSLCHWQKILFPEKILCVCGTQRNRHRERETTKPCVHYHDKRGDEQVRNGGEKNDERKGTVKAASCWRDHPLPVSLQGGSQKILFSNTSHRYPPCLFQFNKSHFLKREFTFSRCFCLNKKNIIAVRAGNFTLFHWQSPPACLVQGNP